MFNNSQVQNMFTRLFGRVVLLSATPVVAAAKGTENGPGKQTLLKPYELPIYTTIFGNDVKK